MGDTESDGKQVLTAALSVWMEKQVGSRYFITARNAGRIFYLRPSTVFPVFKFSPVVWSLSVQVSQLHMKHTVLDLVFLAYSVLSMTMSG